MQKKIRDNKNVYNPTIDLRSATLAHSMPNSVAGKRSCQKPSRPSQDPTRQGPETGGAPEDWVSASVLGVGKAPVLWKTWKSTESGLP